MQNKFIKNLFSSFPDKLWVQSFSGIQHLYEMLSPLVHNHLTFKIQRSTRSSMPSTVLQCNFHQYFQNMHNLCSGKISQVTKGRKDWRKARSRNLQRKAALPTRTMTMSLSHKGRRENMGRWSTLVSIFQMKTSLTWDVTALVEKKKTNDNQCFF